MSEPLKITYSVLVPVGAACVRTAVVPVAGAHEVKAVTTAAFVGPTPQVNAGCRVPPAALVSLPVLAASGSVKITPTLRSKRM
ncbi:MAG TPA: hypothetical protein VFE05_23260 [Longimicrobiaceae bacterium]|nr:hypothetical protein [Longimicrobiaceae bacterium]